MDNLGFLGTVLGNTAMLGIFVWIWNQRERKLDSLENNVRNLQIELALLKQELGFLKDKKS